MSGHVAQDGISFVHATVGRHHGVSRRLQGDGTGTGKTSARLLLDGKGFFPKEVRPRVAESLKESLIGLCQDLFQKLLIPGDEKKRRHIVRMDLE